MAKEDRIPSRSYALIRQLDGMVDAPQMPTNGAGFALLADPQQLAGTAFSAGFRACVDFLVAWMEEEIAEKEQQLEEDSHDVAVGEAAPKYPQVFNAEGHVRRDVAPRQVAIPGTPRVLDDGHSEE